jgi:hypothetical protein
MILQVIEECAFIQMIVIISQEAPGENRTKVLKTTMIKVKS